jgi:hypothetical protein
VIASSLSVSGSTVYRTKRRFVQANLELALGEAVRPGATRKLSDKETALLIATACFSPAEGRKRWTLDLLAGAMVRLTDAFCAGIRGRLGSEGLIRHDHETFSYVAQTGNPWTFSILGA